MRRIFSLFLLTLWCAAFLWLSVASWCRVYIEVMHNIWWLAAIMAVVGLIATNMLWRFIKLWREVASGSITPRLASRAVRNILADGIVFFKTGWTG